MTLADRSQDGRPAVVITGASSGIGAACSVRLARSGYRVFAGVRRPEDAEHLRRIAGPFCDPVLLDVANEASLREAGRRVAAMVGGQGIAALVNNAGISIPGPLEILPLEDVRSQIEVNLVGTIASTQAFLPLVRMRQGRIVNIGSVQGILACPFFGVYAATKAALEAFSDALRVELHAWGVEVVLVQPGRVLTPIWNKILDGADRLSAACVRTGSELYADHMNAFSARARATRERGIRPEQVALVVEKALLARTPKTRYRIGRDAWTTAIAVRLLPDRVRDAILLRKYGLPPGGNRPLKPIAGSSSAAAHGGS